MLKKEIPPSEAEIGYCLTVRATDVHGRSETVAVAVDFNGFGKDCRKIDEVDGLQPLAYFATASIHSTSGLKTTASSGAQTDSLDLHESPLSTSADSLSTSAGEEDTAESSGLTATLQGMGHQTGASETDGIALAPGNKENEYTKLIASQSVGKSGSEPISGSVSSYWSTPVLTTASGSVSNLEASSNLGIASEVSLVTSPSLIYSTSPSFISAIGFSTSPDMINSSDSTAGAFYANKGDGINSEAVTTTAGSSEWSEHSFTEGSLGGTPTSETDEKHASLFADKQTLGDSGEINGEGGTWDGTYSSENSEKDTAGGEEPLTTTVYEEESEEGKNMTQYHSTTETGSMDTFGGGDTISAFGTSVSISTAGELGAASESSTSGSSETFGGDEEMSSTTIGGDGVDAGSSVQASGTFDFSRLSGQAATTDPISATELQSPAGHYFTHPTETPASSLHISDNGVTPTDLPSFHHGAFWYTSPTSFTYNASTSNDTYFQIPPDYLKITSAFPENAGKSNTEASAVPVNLDTGEKWASGSGHFQLKSSTSPSPKNMGSITSTFRVTGEENGISNIRPAPEIPVILPDSGGIFVDPSNKENFVAMACRLKDSKPIWGLICDLSKTARVRRVVL